MRLFVLLLFLLLSLSSNAQYCPVLPYFLMKLEIKNSHGDRLDNVKAFIVDERKVQASTRSYTYHEPLDSIWRIDWHDSLTWYVHEPNFRRFKESGYLCHFGLKKHGVDQHYPLKIVVPEQIINGVRYQEQQFAFNAYECSHLCPKHNPVDYEHYKTTRKTIVLTP